VERARTGGDCLWTGCVPSKALIAAANLAHRMRQADAVGLAPHEPEIDFAQVMDHVRRTQRRIAPQDSVERLRRAGVEVIEADARFLGPGRIQAGHRVLSWRTAMIATGSEPSVPPVSGLAEAGPLTSENLWALSQLPGRLVVLGGGPIGCELGQAFARIGSRVTLVEMAPRLLGREEPAASTLIEDRLRGDGVDVRTGVTPEVVADGVVHLSGGDRVPFDRILVAAGRRPRTGGLGLDAVAVCTDDRGAVTVDERLRTSAPRIFAVGDVTGGLPFTHVAAYHARIATVNALFGGRGRSSYAAVPWVTFTDPEVGRVGLTETEARLRWGEAATTTSFEYAELDRAITAGEAYGFAKLVGDPRRRLVGATVCAPAGGEAIAELAARVAQGCRIDDVSRTVHAYPTFAEGPARAADAHLRARLLGSRTRALARPALAALRSIDALR
ncbi:MAG: FAD-dependent oxidoreductase, partial [Actinomycetota bacterium]|nr:FAD-dependent oxidoreductase [Actinomycetota bacterium]